jgi:hypothetical protein
MDYTSHMIDDYGYRSSFGSVHPFCRRLLNSQNSQSQVVARSWLVHLSFQIKTAMKTKLIDRLARIIDAATDQEEPARQYTCYNYADLSNPVLLPAY